MRDEPASDLPAPGPGGPMDAPRSRLAPTPAIVGALLVLAASFALSVGFVVTNGGMDLPAAASGSPRAAAGSIAPSASPSAEVAAGPSAEASATPISGSPVPTAPSPEPSLAGTPAPSLSATVAPSVAPTAGPTSDRYALLSRCPDAPDCWIYVVRPGDNLVSIANYFGVPFGVVTDLNPWTTTTQLVAGQALRLPPPTR